jgi:hypothetical protein
MPIGGSVMCKFCHSCLRPLSVLSSNPGVRRFSSLRHRRNLITRSTGELGQVPLVAVRRGPESSQKSRSYIKSFGSRRVTWSNIPTDDLQILGTRVRNLCTPCLAVGPSCAAIAPLIFVSDLDYWTNVPQYKYEVITKSVIWMWSIR